MYPLDFRIVIIKKGEIVEAMTSKIILTMPKNQEFSKFQRIKIQEQSSFKIQSSFKNQDSRTIKIKIKESREDSIKISTKKFFKTLSSTRIFHKIFYQRVLVSGNRLPEG